MYSQFVSRVLSLFILFAVCSCAQNTTNNVTKNTADLTNVKLQKEGQRPEEEWVPIDFWRIKDLTKSITYVIVPHMDSDLIYGENEATFKDIGCTFTTNDKAQIGALVNVLQRADIRKAMQNDKDFEVSTEHKILKGAESALYITFLDNSEAKFIFRREYPHYHTNGQYFALYQGAEPHNFYASESLPWILTFWATQLGEASVKVNNKKYTVKNCNDRLRYYINFEWPKPIK